MAARNSKQVLEEVFEQYFDSVYAYVAYRVAPDLEAARDIAHDTFVACFEGFSNYRDEASVLTWLRSIARNKVVDHIRKATGKGACQVGAAAFDEVAAKDHVASFDAEERTLMVGAVMRRLPRHYVDVLEAKYVDDLSVEEIARQRSKTAKAVESTLTRARDAFRVAYEVLIRERKVSP